MDPALALEINDLTVTYARAERAVDSLTLSVRKGEIFGFLGPNGAGKSSTIKAVLGLVNADRGEIRLNGLPVSDPRSRAKVGFLPEEAHYPRFLTAAELLRFYGDVCGVPGSVLKRRVPELLELVGMTASANARISTLSKGMTQKISLAQALVNDPDILILDEPTSGLDPLARLDLRHILAGLREKGRTIFFSSHELSEVELVCDSIAILKKGKLIRSGALKDVLGPHGDRSLEKFFIDAVGGTA